jgi:molybdate transport system substrate-binding protein
LLWIAATGALCLQQGAFAQKRQQPQRPQDPPPQPQIKVLLSGGFAEAFRKLLPEFQQTTGIKVTTARGPSQGPSPNSIGARLRNGESADMVIMSREGLDELISASRIVPGSDVDLAQTPLGISVRAGAPRPDIRSVEGFRQTMLRAKSVTFPGSTTGIYLVNKLFPQLGIAAEMSRKTTNDGIAAVVKGDAEIAIQPISELIHVRGADFVGPVPVEIQYNSVFSGRGGRGFIAAGRRQAPDRISDLRQGAARHSRQRNARTFVESAAQ